MATVEEQLDAAVAIVAGVPPAAALAANGMTGQPSTVLKSVGMRQALRLAIEDALYKAGKPCNIDQAAGEAVAEGMKATRPVVCGGEIQDYPDYATRGAYLDRLLKLTGDFGKSAESDDGNSWDEMVLRMRRVRE